MDVSTQFYPRVCPDWVWSNTSNVSTARDRSWFTSYTPFKSHVTTMLALDVKIKVVGVRTVKIPVRLPSSKKGKRHSIIEVHGVLHTPSSQCNILGQGDFMDRYDIKMGERLITDREGRTLGYFDDAKRLFCLKLSGPPVGPITAPSALMKDDTENSFFSINVLWPESEHAEMVWLKENFKDEKAFLQRYNLSVRNAKDRERGRMHARLMMGQIQVRGDDPHGVSHEDGNEDDNDSESDESSDNEYDPAAHMADYYFSIAELDWIETHYMNSRNFMLIYGLKPEKDEDCEEAKSILKAFMTSGSDDDHLIH